MPPALGGPVLALLLLACTPEKAPGDDAGGDDTMPLSTGSGRAFPDTTARIGILLDQLPSGLSAEQQAFLAEHAVGTQKLTLALSEPLRALNPDFLVLHYHLAIWQSDEDVPFIVDGVNWSNDYPEVTTHEEWFWHNEDGERVASNVDGKWLMNLHDAEFTDYWATSVAEQVRAGDYDAVFFDSASPALLNWQAQSPAEPRLAGTGAADTPIEEWGGQAYIAVWNDWIAEMEARLAAEGIPLVPNYDNFITSWDTSDYTRTSGAFVEGFADRGLVEADWVASTDTILGLVARDRILVFQNYLVDTEELTARRYYLGNYLLVKGAHSYLDYFAASPLEWYPEWELDLGAPLETGASAADLRDGEVYRRDYERGVVLVNPSESTVTVALGEPLGRVEPTGGGNVYTDGTPPGSWSTSEVTEVTIDARGAEILLR